MKRSIVCFLWLSGCFEEQPDVGSTTTGEATESSTTSSTETTASDTTSSSTTSDPDTSSSSGEATTSESESSSTGPDPITDWALYFDGTAWAQSTSVVELDLGADFTVEAWIRTDSADATGVIASYRGVGTTGWSLEIDDTSHLLFGFFDNNGAWNEALGNDVADLGPGWHHVAGTKRGTSIYLHVDGQVAATGPCSEANSAPTVAIVLGTETDGEPLVGIAIDDLRISNVARYQEAFEPEAELAADPSTLVLLALDEADGTACFDTGARGLTFDLQAPTWTQGNTR